MLTFKYRIYPNKEQQKILENYFYCCTVVYNYMLKYKYDNNQNGKICTSFDLNLLLTKLKQTDEFNFLNKVPAQSLQEINKIIIKSFKNEKSPKIKKRNINYIYFIQHCKIENNYIKLKKIGYIKTKFHRECKGNIKIMILKKEKNGKYYVSIVTDYNKEKQKENKIIGIDLGIKNFATLSNGIIIENKNFSKEMLKKESKYKKQLSKKESGSKNFEKQLMKLNKIYLKIKNKNNDYFHKISNEISKKYGTIIFENLNEKDMLKHFKKSPKNSNIRRFLMFSGWEKFKKMLKYKSKIIEIDRYEPSSKKCSNCGNIKKELKLTDRIYKCSKCGLIIDRDLNAAINIKNIGIEKYKT